MKWRIKFKKNFIFLPHTWAAIILVVIGIGYTVNTYVLNSEKVNRQPATKKSTIEIDEEIIPAPKISTENLQKQNTQKKTQQSVPKLDKHWIADANGVYLQNPEPTDGETMTWSGGYVQEGQYKFANGFGVTTWYRYGKIIQVDEGTFIKGKRDGAIKHKFFPSGNEDVSYWDNGKMIDSSSNTSSNTSNAKKAFLNFHQNITNKNYRQAYSTMTSNQQNRVGKFDNWVKGYSDTISSDISELILKNETVNSVTFDYTLIARDNFGGNVKVQSFNGEVTMLEKNGVWYIDQAHSKKVAEYIE